jgi:hypothetical protein
MKWIPSPGWPRELTAEMLNLPGTEFTPGPVRLCRRISHRRQQVDAYLRRIRLRRNRRLGEFEKDDRPSHGRRRTSRPSYTATAEPRRRERTEYLTAFDGQDASITTWIG